MKQTAVEYFVEELKRIGFSTNNILEFENEVQIAKEMEKQQIIDAHNNRDNKSATLYYNETFKPE